MLSCTSNIKISVPQSESRDHINISADTRIAIEQYREELFPQSLECVVTDSGCSTDIALDIENYCIRDDENAFSVYQEAEYLFAAIARMNGDMRAYVQTYNIDSPDDEDTVVELNSSATIRNSNLSNTISTNTRAA